MRRKVKRISEDLAERLSGWEQVDTITLLESGEEELYNPYFFLSLDVYYSGNLPEAETRQKLFSDAGAFESSSTAKKDRFLLEDMPVRVEYKNIDRINTLLDRIEENLWVFRQTGTYMFYRLQQGKLLFNRSDWLTGIQERLQHLPDSYWEALSKAATATMEHYLTDMKSAAMEEDSFFYLISSAGFIKSLVSSLFIINHRFEPSGRNLADHLFNLPVLPENFRGRYESFISDDQEFTPARKCEIAVLLAKSLFRLI
ncbi:MAG: DUF4037 domain-containing protein [Spirochaetales bacterium]|nr:DUF4037 domain-containing protein [Spirochaetales bacterium]